ncbi:hypothetical protein DFQ30_004343, partial [Apophysomyces sp. BC1015]
MEVPGVSAAYVYPLRRGLGTVDVVVTATQGLPSKDTIAAVQAHIDSVRPVTAKNSLVLAPTIKSVDVKVAVKTAGTTLSDLTPKIQSALDAYFAALAPGEPVVKSRMEAIVSDLSGVMDRAMTVPAENIVPVIDANVVEWCRLRTVTHADLLACLLPPISYVPTEPRLRAQLAAEGAALDAAQGNAARVLGGMTPIFADTLLADWERVCGLTGVGGAPYQARLQAVLSKLAEMGSLSISYLVQMAKRMGYTIMIDEPQPCRAGSGRAGQRLAVFDVIWVWRVNVQGGAVRAYRFRAGMSRAGERLTYAADPVIESVFNELKPAHTLAIFTDGTEAVGYLDGMIVKARWLNVIQAELKNVVEQFGGELDSSRMDQISTLLLDALARKAPLESPVLTGQPTAPTPSQSDSSTKVATTAFVRQAL